LVRDINEEATAGKRYPPWRRVDEWARTQPSSREHKIRRGDGAKGPIYHWYRRTKNFPPSRGDPDG